MSGRRTQDFSQDDSTQYEGGEQLTSHSSFMDRQARENAEPALKKFPVIVLLSILGVGALVGLFFLVQFLMTYPQTSAAKNVQLTLVNPKIEAGTAFVDVQVVNDNNASVKQMTMHYTITGASGGTISDGDISLDQLVAAGSKAVIPHVKLGAISEAPKSLHADVTQAFCP
ncbi:MAG: hypothetical protein P4L53_19200 [Candidatus Obscuribacterales bacterium]|nr:hypothetical protein [Candidatus Obscuribacterales bacterium]